jgi:hypothetical protein
VRNAPASMMALGHMYTHADLDATLASSGLLASGDARKVLTLGWLISPGEVFSLAEPLASSFTRRAAGPPSLTGNHPALRSQLAELGANLDRMRMLGKPVEWLSIYYPHAGRYEILRVPDGGPLLGCYFQDPPPLKPWL